MYQNVVCKENHDTTADKQSSSCCLIMSLLQTNWHYSCLRDSLAIICARTEVIDVPLHTYYCSMCAHIKSPNQSSVYTIYIRIVPPSFTLMKHSVTVVSNGELLMCKYFTSTHQATNIVENTLNELGF